MTRDEARNLDAVDPLRGFRDRFILPDGIIYLDGNSLGALPRGTSGLVADMVDRQWGDRLVRSWNEGWIDAPQRIGDKIARLIGADPGEVVACDSTSVNLFKLIVGALRRDPARTTIVTEIGNFPTDLHIAHGAASCVTGGQVRAVPRDAIAGAIDETTALLLLTHVHYKTAERFDMVGLTERAQASGALVLWDLSHSVGAIPVDLGAAGADLAVGCGYKYLNGGPGAPAFLYVAARHQAALGNPVSGWMGHAAPFAFGDDYAPANGVGRWLSGTPGMLGMAGLEAGVDLMLEADPEAIARKSASLFGAMHAIGTGLGLECVTPRDPHARGSHISFRHADAHALCQALIADGVIGDFREPDILRFGLTPLYLSHTDIVTAGDRLAAILADERYLLSRFSKRHAVT